MPAPYYTNREEKEAFFNKQRDFYKDIGYNPEEIEQIIADKLADDEMDREYESLQEGRDLFFNNFERLEQEKYHVFTPLAPNMNRVASAMYKPENSLENIRYNEILAQKLTTQRGQIEVLQEAVTLLGTVDPKKMAAYKDDPNLLEAEYNPLALCFIAKSLEDAVDFYKKSKDHEMSNLDIPAEVMDHISSCRSFFESMSDIKNRYYVKGSVCNLICPRDIDEVKLFMTNQVADDKDKTAWSEYTTGRTTAQEGIDPAKFHQPKPEYEEVCEKFYRKIRSRMAEDMEDPEATAERVEALGDTREFIYTNNTIGLRNVHSKKEREEPIRVRNDEQMDRRMKKLILQAKKNYDSSLKEAAGDVYGMLRANTKVFYENENYQRMLDSMDKVRKIVRNEPMSAEARNALSENLTELSKAAYAYLDNKMKEGRRFSEFALDRIDAARLVSTFVDSTKAKMALEENVRLKAELAQKKAELDARKYDFAEARYEFTECVTNFRSNPSPEAFARARAWHSISNALNKNGNVYRQGTVTASEVEMVMSNNVKAYRALSESSKEFREALKSGDMRTAEAAAQKAVADLQKPADAPKKEVAVEKVAEIPVQGQVMIP